MSTEVTAAGVTDTLAWSDSVPTVAVTEVLPTPAPVTRPQLSTVATDVEADCQVAVNGTESPNGALFVLGLMSTAVTTGAVTFTVVFPVTLPTAAEASDAPTDFAVTKPVVPTVATAVVAEVQVAAAVMFCVEPSE